MRQKRVEPNIQTTERNYPRKIYPAKLFFKYEGEIKTFADQKLKEFSSRRHVLQEILKEVFLPETKNKGHKTMNKITNTHTA